MSNSKTLEDLSAVSRRLTQAAFLALAIAGVALAISLAATVANGAHARDDGAQSGLSQVELLIVLHGGVPGGR